MGLSAPGKMTVCRQQGRAPQGGIKPQLQRLSSAMAPFWHAQRQLPHSSYARADPPFPAPKRTHIPYKHIHAHADACPAGVPFGHLSHGTC
jgi:hypothetical protein